jgi:hypothetical protein
MPPRTNVATSKLSSSPTRIFAIFIAQQLRFMNRQHMFNTFEFKDDQIVHNQIDTITVVQVDAFICDRKPNLPSELNPTEVQLVTQAFFASRF